VVKKLWIIFLLFFLNLFSISYSDIVVLNTQTIFKNSISPTAATTIVAFRCPTCSPANQKTFSLSLLLSKNTSCLSPQTLNLSPTVLNNSNTYYLDADGLNTYAIRLSPSFSIRCVMLNEGPSVGAIALTSGPPYARTYPLPPLPINTLILA